MLFHTTNSAASGDADQSSVSPGKQPSYITPQINRCQTKLDRLQWIQGLTAIHAWRGHAKIDTNSVKNVAFELYTGWAPNPKTQKLFWGPQNSLHKNLEIFHTGHDQDTKSHLLFQNWSISVHDQWPKKHRVFLQLPLPQKHIFVPFGGTLWAIPPKLFCLWYLTVVPHLYSEFCPIWFRFWGVIAEKNLLWPAKVTVIWALVGSSNL